VIQPRRGVLERVAGLSFGQAEQYQLQFRCSEGLVQIAVDPAVQGFGGGPAPGGGQVRNGPPGSTASAAKRSPGAGSRLTWCPGPAGAGR
jgi:hypothetical protein